MELPPHTPDRLVGMHQAYPRIRYSLIIGLFCSISLNNHLTRFWERTLLMKWLLLGAFILVVGALVYRILFQWLAERVRAAAVVKLAWFAVCLLVGALLVHTTRITPIDRHELRIAPLEAGALTPAEYHLNLLEIRADGGIIPLEQVNRSDQWVDSELGIALETRNDPGLSFHFPGSTYRQFEILFASGPEAGETVVVIDDFKQIFDLNEAEAGVTQIDLKVTNWRLLLIAADSLLAGLLLFIATIWLTRWVPTSMDWNLPFAKTIDFFMDPVWSMKIDIFIWMALIVFIELILYGSPEWWLLMERLGFSQSLNDLHLWLKSILSARYLG